VVRSEAATDRIGLGIDKRTAATSSHPSTTCTRFRAIASGCERSCGCKKSVLFCTILWPFCQVICESDTDRKYDFNAKESKDEFNADSLVLTNETFDFQVTDRDFDLEDHIDECDFI